MQGCGRAQGQAMRDRVGIRINHAECSPTLSPKHIHQNLYSICALDPHPLPQKGNSDISVSTQPMGIPTPTPESKQPEQFLVHC